MDRNQAKGQTNNTTGKAGNSSPKAMESRPGKPKVNGQKGNGSPAPADAIALLTADHKRVRQMFNDYEQLGEKAHASKQRLAQQICEELTVHAQVEEEILYPAARDAIKDDDLMDEADVEHAAAKELIAQLESMTPDESHYDAKVKVLGEEVAHHIKEEQDEMFAKIRKSGLDLAQLGQQIAARKAELQTASPSRR